MERPEDILRERFGYGSFRTGQREVISAIMGGRDALAVMPTGAGKSLCYQVPALALPGITLVVSPLISLMRDQVSALVQSGVAAAFLNSQLEFNEREEVLWRAEQGEFKLLYVAPERLADPAFAGFATRANVSLVAIDEAHCVSQWGQDFRPSYLGIADFIANLGTRPVVAAFTATATPRVASDVTRLLGLRDPLVVTTGFDRPNLRFEVEQLSDKRKTARLLSIIRERAGESGIVYCSTRKRVDQLHEELVAMGVPATRYHAGLTAIERDRNQRAFVNDDAPIVVATNAFGMGIDKSNVRYVVHYNMPGSLEAYYQEAGRAGRDGEPALCLLLWNDSDIATARFFIEQDSGNEALTLEEADAVRMSQRRRLSAMTGYCLTTDCLRATILRYFGDAQTAGEGCENCSNCDDGAADDAIDVTLTARSVMRCVHELRGRFGKGTVTDVLTGSRNARLLEWGLDKKRTYDIVDEPAGTVKEIIELLAAGDYLEISEGRYPLVGLGPRAREAATDEFRLYMKRKPKRTSARESASGRGGKGSWKGKGAASASAAGPAAGAADVRGSLSDEERRELFERLRQLRKRLADAEGVPPYIVFSDAALRGMCASLPRTPDELLDVSGVGPAKLARYGDAFLAEINHP